ncbi:MAG: glycosyltransferase [Leptolyngbya sp. SIOISBB]|nr:glycosyltransferase [Leptolyngbya sp. SIOISBB]
MTPLVSVIIPAYNCEKTIQDTLESVRKQSYSNLEVIVIDDGSRDSTVRSVASIAEQDTRIKVFSYANAGPAVARNRGIEKSEGDFIAFLDADDLWTPDKISDQVTALQNHPQAGLAYSWIDWIDEADQFLRHGSHIDAEGDVLSQLLLRNFIDNGSNALVRSDVLDQIGQFDSTLPPSEDWDMWLRIAAKYEFVCIPKVQVFYRILKTSLSTNILKLSQANLKIIDNFFLSYPELKATIGEQAYADKYRYFTFKSIEGAPSRQNGWLALRFFAKAISIEPEWWLKRIKLFFLVLLKAILFTASPSMASLFFCLTFLCSYDADVSVVIHLNDLPS